MNPKLQHCRNNGEIFDLHHVHTQQAIITRALSSYQIHI